MGWNKIGAGSHVSRAVLSISEGRQRAAGEAGFMAEVEDIPERETNTVVLDGAVFPHRYLAVC